VKKGWEVTLIFSKGDENSYTGEKNCELRKEVKELGMEKEIRGQWGVWPLT